MMKMIAGWVAAVSLLLGVVAASPAFANAAKPTAAIGGGPSTSSQAANRNRPANAVVVSSRPTVVGHVLVTSSGFSLYDFSGDALPSVTGCLPSNLSVQPPGVPCTQIWRPLLATGPL